jgi:hypothetical protein
MADLLVFIFLGVALFIAEVVQNRAEITTNG